jgi:hypothetical protein
VQSSPTRQRRSEPTEYILEVFREFEVKGNRPSQLADLMERVSDDLPAGWQRDSKREAEIERRIAAKQYVFSVPATAVPAPGSGRPATFLFAWLHGTHLEVTNIVPAGIGQLTKGEYNSILVEFEKVVSPLATLLGLEEKTTSDQIQIGDLLSDDAWNALRRFSVSANKSTGSSHPLDRQRWVQFLVLEHRSVSRLNAELLKRWLVEEEHWPDDVALDLVVEFEFSTDLLKAYDNQL